MTYLELDPTRLRITAFGQFNLSSFQELKMKSKGATFDLPSAYLWLWFSLRALAINFSDFFYLWQRVIGIGPFRCGAVSWNDPTKSVKVQCTLK